MHTATATADATSAVDLRAMQPDDAERLLRFHHSLSPETVYLRFFSVHPDLRPDELDRFTHVDHEQREAIVAVVDDDIVGVARFDRTGADTAEVAFVVADRWQGKGLGTMLFEALEARAREVGIDRFTAETLPHNERMLSVFRHCGHPHRSWYDAGVVHVEMDLRQQLDASAAPSA
jgi:RimJ/RimL family protein N-acetyltransferase